ncbi:condensation domain-containing protein [Streptomyces natalensis]|uniref:condensation domain-containing protein n=1 Tax=Streptomyces natalensis TaxID=68242 RepID=UPI0004AABD7D|nr:condensation domain-containing protein [Streptomyces natalensis]
MPSPLPAPLTAAQRALWHAQARDPDSPAHTTAACVEIHGPLDAVRFAEALHRTVGESDALRLRIEETPDGPRQFPVEIEPPGHGFALHAATLLDLGDPDAVARAWMRDDLARPFDLAAGPLFRHALFQVGARRWLWYQRVHRLALDGHGFTLVLRRVAQLYTTLAAGEDPGPSPFGRLADLAAEERAYRAGEGYDADRTYWRHALADRPQAPTLAGRSAPAARTPLRTTAHLGAELTQRIDALAAAVRATWPDVLITAQACHLAQATGSREVVLGLPLRGRISATALRVPGAVGTVLPLRLAVPAGATFADLTRQTVLAVRAARRHQRYRPEDIRRDLGLPGHRRLTGPRIHLLHGDDAPAFAGAPSAIHHLAAGAVDDMTLTLHRRPHGAGLRIDHDANPALYEECELAAHQDRFLDLLGRLADADPHTAPAAPDRPGLVGGTRAQIIDKGRTPRRTSARRTDVPTAQLALSLGELCKGEAGTAARGRAGDGRQPRHGKPSGDTAPRPYHRGLP